MSNPAESQPSTVDGSVKESRVIVQESQPVVIDHLSYPHIIDRILNFSATKALLSFRFANKSYTSRCHELIGRHLLVGGTGHGDPPLWIESNRRKLPCFSQDYISFDKLCTTVGQSYKLFRLCRVLEVVGSTSLKAPGVLSSSLSRLQTLRIRHNYRGYSQHNFQYRASTTIVFGSLPVFDWANDGTYRWNGCVFPPTTRKLAWSVTGLHTAPYYGKNLFHFSPPLFVLHFRFYNSTKPVPPDPLYAVIQSIRFALRKGSHTTVKVVDFDLVPLTALNFEDAPVDHPQTRQLRIIEQLGDLADRLSFLTGDEYVDEYGQEQYTIETCEELW